MSSYGCNFWTSPSCSAADLRISGVEPVSRRRNNRSNLCSKNGKINNLPGTFFTITQLVLLVVFTCNHIFCVLCHFQWYFIIIIVTTSFIGRWKASISASTFLKWKFKQWVNYSEYSNNINKMNNYLVWKYLFRKNLFPIHDQCFFCFFINILDLLIISNTNFLRCSNFYSLNGFK